MIDKSAIQELAQAEAITAATSALEGCLELAKNGIAALPENFTVHDLEAHLPMRRRQRGVMSTPGIDSFASYVENHADHGATIFIDQDHMTAKAVLDLGTHDRPGHAENLAVFTAKATSAFRALLAINGRQITQTQAAEFFEDWADCMTFFKDATKVTPSLAIAAVRKITIEALRKQDTSEQQLSSSRSTFEAVSASSSDPIPTTIYFDCEPYVGLVSRTFVLRLAIMTGDKPMLVLRIIKLEEHEEQMAGELAEIVRAKVGAGIPTVIGTYTRK